jgi:hypothetical protein
MSFNVSNNFIADAQSVHFISCVLLQINFDSGPVRLSDLSQPVSWNGFTWDGIGTLGGVETIRNNSTGEVIATKFVLSGVPLAAVPLVLSEQYQNRQLQLWLARFDKNTMQIVEAVRVQNSLVSTLELNHSATEQGVSVQIILTAESKSVLLNRPKSRRSNHEDHLAQYPTDGFFKNVAAISQQEITWPSKEAQAQYV